MKVKEIAKALHLSESTVSKALNGAFDVSKETKQTVLAYAKAHGYKFKDERLTVKGVRRLCFIYDNVDSMSQSNIIIPLGLAFSSYARNNNFEVVQTPIKTITTSYNDFMKENNFDGAFIAGLNYKSPLLNELKDTVYPTVLYDNVMVGDMVATINNENINTIANLIKLLKKLGHTKIGFINGDRNSFVSNERFAGYIIGQISEDIEYNPNYVYYGDFTESCGIKAAKYFSKTDVTAVVCVSDLIAIGLIGGLEKEGLKVPDDISVTGYDDLDISKYFKPSLTTIKQDLNILGEKAFTLLTSILMNRSSQRLVINGEIKIRESISVMRPRSLSNQ